MPDKNNEEKPKQEKQSAMSQQKMFYILIAMFTVVMVLMIGQTYLLMSKVTNNSIVKEQNSKSASEKKVKEASEIAEMEITQLEPLTVNLADTDYKRYLRVQLSIAYTMKNAETDKKKLEKHVPLFKAKTIEVLRNKTYADLSSVELSKKAAIELKQAFNKTMGDELIKEVLFTDFILQ